MFKKFAVPSITCTAAYDELFREVISSLGVCQTQLAHESLRFLCSACWHFLKNILKEQPTDFSCIEFSIFQRWALEKHYQKQKILKTKNRLSTALGNYLVRIEVYSSLSPMQNLALCRQAEPLNVLQSLIPNYRKRTEGILPDLVTYFCPTFLQEQVTQTLG